LYVATSRPWDADHRERIERHQRERGPEWRTLECEVELGALALIEALTLIVLDEASEREQNEELATFAPKIERDMARVPWDEGNGVVARHIRAYDPRPGAFTVRNGQELKLFGALATEEGGDEGSTKAGQVLEIDATGMLVACGDGAVRVLQVQAPGKRRISALEFARGRGIAVGDVLGVNP